MAKLAIVQHPHPTLRQSAHEVTPNTLQDKKFQQFIQDLMETLESQYPQGAGLSANQVDQLYRVFVINVEIDENNFFKQVFINPEITDMSTATATDWEGCLSFIGPDGEPDQWGQVKRALAIKLRAVDPSGEPIELQASHFLARLIQHEIDHLNGILFIDKLESELVNTKQLEDILRQENEPHARVG